MRRRTIDKSVATVSSKGQVTIPKHLRDELGITMGDELRFVRGPGNRVIIAPRNNDLEDLLGSLKSPLSTPLTIEEMKEIAADGWAFGEADERGSAAQEGEGDAADARVA